MNIREFLWNYPVNLNKVTKKTAPLSFIFFFGAIFFLVFSSILASDDISSKILSKPVDRIVEGSVGMVTNLNPLYIPTTQAERDLEELIFEKFIRIDSSGTPIPSIASKWIISNDFKEYKFTIAPNHFWHDGEKVDADDVVFSFEMAIDLAKRFSQDTYGQSIQDVKIKKIDNMEVRFTLTEQNATFFESLAVYIVPEHILGKIRINEIDSSNYSQFPVGSGAYSVVNNVDTKISLEAVDEQASIKYYDYLLFESPNTLEVAFRNGLLDIVSGVSLAESSYLSEYSKQYNTIQFPLYFRKKILFINNRIDSFGNSSIRRALNYLTDKKGLLEITKIDGEPSLSSIPRTSWAFDSSLNYYEYNRKNARGELTSVGYKKDDKTGYFQTSEGKILSMTLTYLENDLNTRLADSLQVLWEKEGIALKLNPKSYNQMTKEVLATRDFELLLYEIETTIDPDQYDLWHSLRVDYPYLNLSGYSYDRVDVFLERGREEIKRTDRKENYISFQKLLMADAPAIFLYEPSFNLIVSERLKGVSVEGVNTPSDRYNSIADWILE